MGDCSLLVWRIYFRCGKLVSRITAKEMAAGKGGWKGRNVAYSKAKQASLAFFTFKPILRVNGHVGILLDDTKSDYNELAHASSEFNKFMRVGMGPEVDNAFWKHLNWVIEID
jgi:cell wall-associated NlpC family hydrolase